MKQLIRASNTLVRLEKVVIAALAAAITLLILLNVGTRAANLALFWVDELAVYSMVWMVLIGSSVMVRERSGIAASLFVDLFNQQGQRAFRLLVDLLVLAFSVTLLILCWYWFDFPALVVAGFDLDSFSENTFNFIYQEPTTTLGIKKYFVWLVVPLMAFSLTLHSLCNLIEDFSNKPSKEGRR